MKKTMTKEDFLELLRKELITPEEFYDRLSESGINFDIYYDSDVNIIKPGDMCEFGATTTWKAPFLGKYNGLYFGATKQDHNYSTTCRKLPTEVWEPVPMEDIQFDKRWALGFLVNPDKWEKWRTENGKLEGVRK